MCSSDLMALCQPEYGGDDRTVYGIGYGVGVQDLVWASDRRKTGAYDDGGAVESWNYDEYLYKWFPDGRNGDCGRKGKAYASCIDDFVHYRDTIFYRKYFISVRSYGGDKFCRIVGQRDFDGTGVNSGIFPGEHSGVAD